MTERELDHRAFQEAITSYSMDKGSFLSFLRLLIQRRLIDALRAAGREPATIPLDTELGEEIPEDRSSSQLREEILAVTQQLDGCSPTERRRTDERCYRRNQKGPGHRPL